MASVVVRSYYHYEPSLVAAVIFAALYGLAFIATVVQWVRYRAWVWLAMVVASGMEAAGYVVRSLDTQDVSNKDLYIVQFSLIVLAPVLMAAACYVAFGRIVFHVVPKESRTLKLLWISPRWLTPTFVTFDIVALFLQLIGAVVITSISPTDPNALSKANKGKRIAQIGVAVQLIFFGLFSIIAVRFNFIARRFAAGFEERISNPNEKWITIDGGEKKLKKNWPIILHVTNVASASILIRSIYRMVDFTLGRSGYTETHEWCAYIFDATAIFPVVALYALYPPGQFLPYLGFRIPKHSR